ncbi:MAG: hypothetical protein JWN34_5634 [Bryobacterales bacterium]|jgi:hypothetical protein|nr:hypothetical protein [Bryobacterales bacterium]
MLTRRAILAAFALPTARQASLLREAAARALAYTRELPDFVCTESIRRSDNVRSSGWRTKDTLEVQVGIANRREYYKLITRNGSPTTLSYRQAGGALTEGEFGSLLAEIFRPDAANFSRKREMKLGGREIAVFAYEVPSERATYRLEYGYRSGQPQTTRVGHKGEVWIDAESSRVVRVDQTATIPKSFPLKVSKTTLDFAWTEIAGTEWLLPRQSISIMGSNEILTRNEVVFRDYRRFTADSSVVFEQP